MPEITIPSFVITGLQMILAFVGAFTVALWISLIVWTFRDAKARSRDIFAILLATLMVVVFGPLGVLLYFLLRPHTTLAELYERSLEEEALLQDLEERPHCPGCSRQVVEAWVVCPDCHTTLKKACPSCGQKLNLTWDVCPFCATPSEVVPQLTEPVTPGLPQPVAASLSQSDRPTQRMRPSFSRPGSRPDVRVEKPNPESASYIEAEVIAEPGIEGNGHYPPYHPPAVDGEVVPEYAPSYERSRRGDETRPQSPQGSL
ncbi:MAG TPA: zinc ribbon domain-containing protein [Anaerolineae bacterium]|nr:zinc ribbon domain-containing protein [Anaerolineae bacterium]HMR68423.1 zinc ribbon domain-containing protein [Anaerolineae bacterium]